MKNKSNNLKNAKALSDDELEITLGGRSTEIKFFSIEKGICECALEIDNGKLASINFPTNDREFRVTKKHLPDLVNKGLINNDVYNEILNKL